MWSWKYEMKEQTILNAETTDSDHLDTHRLDTENDIKTILNNIWEWYEYWYESSWIITLMSEHRYIVLFSLTTTTYGNNYILTAQQLYIELFYLSNLNTKTNLINVINLTFPPYYINSTIILANLINVIISTFLT